MNISSCGGGGGGGGDKGGAGDGGGGGDGGTPLSKAEYIKQANAICAAGQAKVAALEAPSDARRAAADTATWLDGQVSAVKDGIKDLRSLTPPRADEATISSLLKLVDAQLVQLERARDAAARNDQQGYDAAAAAYQSAYGAANRVANNYGLDVCGRSDAPTSRAPSVSSTDDAAKDVQITSCGPTDSRNLPEVKGTVVNSTSHRASYDIYVAFLDASDRQIASGIEFVSNVAPGGTALWHTAAAEDYQPGIRCKISKVNRTTSE